MAPLLDLFNWLNEISGYEIIKLITQPVLAVIAAGIVIKLNNLNQRRKTQRRDRTNLSYFYFEFLDMLKTFKRDSETNTFSFLNDYLWDIYKDSIKDTGRLYAFYLTSIYYKVNLYNKKLQQYNKSISESEKYIIIEEYKKEIIVNRNEINNMIMNTLKIYDSLDLMKEFLLSSQESYNNLKNITDVDISPYKPKYEVE